MSIWRASRRRIWIVCVVALVAALLVGARLAAPSIVAKVVRNALHQLKGGYHGDIRDVRLSVLDGEVHILGMRIEKSNGRVPVPFLEVEDFTLAFVREGWQPRTELHVYRPTVNLVDAEQKAEQQWGPDFKLTELREKLPAELRAVFFEDGELHFRKLDAKPKIDAVARKIDATWDDLTGCLPPGWVTCRSRLTLKANVVGSGALAGRGRFDRHDGAHMQASARLRNLHPTQLNPVLLEYAKIDAQGGEIDLEALFTQHEDKKRVVLVPRLYDVKIAGSEHEKTKWIREAAVGIAAGWFERKRGTKAIAYKKHGAEGEWSIIDWQPEHASSRDDSPPLAHAR